MRSRRWPRLSSHKIQEKQKRRGFIKLPKGTAEDAKAFIDRLEIFSLLANVADVKSLVIHSAGTTHSQMSEKELLPSGIKPNTVRLSVGTEHIDDLIGDLAQAF